METVEDGARVFPIARSGRLGRPWRVAIPGRVAGVDDEASIVLDSHGRVVVGLVYGDGALKGGSSGPHASPGCCEQIAIASWRLGATPPAAQVFVRAPEPSPSNPYAHEALEPPSIVIGPSSITALWARGYPAEIPEEEGETQVEEAFGKFGGPLHQTILATAAKGVTLPHLGLAPDGDPIASWLEDERSKIRTVGGLRSGALNRPTRVQSLQHLAQAPRSFSQAVGFSSNEAGDTEFAYLSGSRSFDFSKMLLTSSSAGGPFRRARTVFSGREVGGGEIVAGGHGVVLALPESPAEIGLLGSVSSPFLRRVTVEAGGTTQGWVDSQGRAVIVYEQPFGKNETDITDHLEAVTAAPGQPFTLPRQVAPQLDDKECALNTESDEPSPIASSPNGRAIIYVTCTPRNGNPEQYLIRYTP